MRLLCWQWRQVYIGNSAHLPASDRLLSCNLVFSCNYRLYGGLIILQHTAQPRPAGPEHYWKLQSDKLWGSEIAGCWSCNLSHSLVMEQFESNKKCFWLSNVLSLIKQNSWGGETGDCSGQRAWRTEAVFSSTPIISITGNHSSNFVIIHFYACKKIKCNARLKKGFNTCMVLPLSFPFSGPCSFSLSIEHQIKAVSPVFTTTPYFTFTYQKITSLFVV